MTTWREDLAALDELDRLQGTLDDARQAIHTQLERAAWAIETTGKGRKHPMGTCCTAGRLVFNGFYQLTTSSSQEYFADFKSECNYCDPGIGSGARIQADGLYLHIDKETAA